MESACAELNARQCDYLQGCGLLAPGDDAHRDCERFLVATRCAPSGWPARVKAGTLRYHAVTARACADGWLNHACADFEREPLGCDAITSPSAPLGQRCYGGPEPECLQGRCTGGTCPRSCRPLGDLGQVCEQLEDCKLGLYCRPATSGGPVGTCALPGAPSAPCDSWQLCQPGLYCGDFGHCLPRIQLGEPCQPGNCEEGTYCAIGFGGASCQLRLAEGEGCEDDHQCRPELICLEETGTCASPGPLAAGEPCSRRQSCAGGLACTGTREDPLSPPRPGTCGPAAALGAACTSSWDCAPPLACAVGGDGGTCTQRLAEGARCEAARDCAQLSVCHQGSCLRLPHPGEMCPAGSCVIGVCESGHDGGSLCKGPGGPNAPCQEDEDCSSLKCADGACLAACSP